MSTDVRVNLNRGRLLVGLLTLEVTLTTPPHLYSLAITATLVVLAVAAGLELLARLRSPYIRVLYQVAFAVDLLAASAFLLVFGQAESSGAFACLTFLGYSAMASFGMRVGALFGTCAIALLLIEEREFTQVFSPSTLSWTTVLFWLVVDGLLLYIPVLLAGSDDVPQTPAARRAIHKADIPLSEREIAILRLAAQGHSYRSIAKALSVAEGTVKAHASHIFAKLSVRNITEAVAWAVQTGVAGDDPPTPTTRHEPN